MKGNDGSGNIPERDEWETPKELFDNLNEQYNFTFDCCASKNNKKCEFYFKDFLNIKNKNPKAMFWMNPPFSKAYEMFEHFFKVIKQGVAIYRCDNIETKIWSEIIFKKATWILVPKGRISYEGQIIKGGGSRFPSALIGFNVEMPKFVEGTILKIINRDMTFVEINANRRVHKR